MTGGGRGSRGLVKNTAEGIREDKSFQQTVQCVCACTCKHACTDMSFLQMICLCVCLVVFMGVKVK